jgi:hypothetical protein
VGVPIVAGVVVVVEVGVVKVVYAARMEAWAAAIAAAVVVGTADADEVEAIISVE